MKHSKFPYFVLIPLLLLMFVFIVLPIIGSFVISFMDYNPLRAEGNCFVGFKNYARLFTDNLFSKSFVNTMVFVLSMTVLNLVMTLIVAQLLAGLQSGHWRSFFRVTFFMPCVAPLAAVAIVWQRCILPVKGGLLNMGLTVLGLSAVNWLDTQHLMFALIMLSLWADVGYNIVLFTSGIEGIPTNYFEAAEIDGAGPIRRFFSITLPLLNRTFTFVSITTVISYFQAFAQFSIVAKGGGSGYAGYVMSTYIYDMGFVNKDMGYASALSVVLFMVIMVFTLIQRRATKVDWGY